ncbi:MAG: hypothetical protein ABW321_07230 [Polyangiales bacterium]
MPMRIGWGASTHWRRMTLMCVFAVAAVSCDDDFRECAEPGAELMLAPLRLSETGLYSDITSETLSPDVLRYTPQFALWSDGADKRRFAWLPPGTTINNGDPDAWQLPVGTKLWKELGRDGVRAETRYLERVGDDADAWLMVAYVWNETGTEAVRAEAGRNDVLGTSHDVPRAADCAGCHAGRPGRVLGFSAVQLAAPARAGEIDLRWLSDRGQLTHPLSRTPQLAGPAAQVEGLGYLHANCSHCHNQDRPASDGPRCYDPHRDFDFLLRVGDHRVQDTAAYHTADDVLSFGDPNSSRVLRRMSTRASSRMPPLATEQVDTLGVAQVRALVESL